MLSVLLQIKFMQVSIDLGRFDFLFLLLALFLEFLLDAHDCGLSLGRGSTARNFLWCFKSLETDEELLPIALARLLCYSVAEFVVFGSN